ncbi:MAG TPA: glycosyltransferase [Candidatus Baltobacteraceae bacterium]|nr:glycosyltransferase [Candidatus Baltobacteraceae bacterium]
MARYRITQIEDYEQFIGREQVQRIRENAQRFKGTRVANFNSTYYGGGVAETLSSLTLLMNSLGLRTEWRVIEGTPDFFSITKKMHNALQGGEIDLSSIKKEIFEQVIYENSVRNFLEHDFVIVHDPQPVPLIEHYEKKCPWIWRCHLDLSRPNAETWKYLLGWIDNYDAVIESCPEYNQEMKPPQRVFMPAIDPFTIKNRQLSDQEIDERLAHYEIPTDLPLVAQISRFDPWKDPEGVVKAFKLARKQVDARLVLLGNFATDDPEGARIFETLRACQDESILILTSGDDTALVNALQTRAAVVLQKSLREGFGLTVAEAMWKGTPVIGGNVGGIRYQIENGVNGFLVSSIDEAAERIVRLLKDEKLREEMGRKARKSVRDKFLLTRYLEEYLDLFGEFDKDFRLRE